MSFVPTPLFSFFSIAEREYTHFTFDADARETARNLIIALCIGIILAATYMLYQKQVPGAIVRAILGAEALSPESAKSAAELGLTNWLYRHEFKRNLTLKRLIKIVEADDTEQRYYIPEELKYRAEIRYDNKGNGLFGFIFTVIATLALGILIIKMLPAVLSMIDFALS